MNFVVAGGVVNCAAAAKSLQSCPTLCDPIDGSPPGSPVPGILQARNWSGLTVQCVKFGHVLNGHFWCCCCLVLKELFSHTLAENNAFCEYMRNINFPHRLYHPTD